MEEQNEELVPKKQSLFPISGDDIVDNALQNLNEKQAAEVTKKAADEVVRIAIEKRKAEYRSSTAQEEMRNLINNANLLDQRGGDYKINSTFETATGTTNVEIHKSKFTTFFIAGIIGFVVIILILLAIVFTR
jgi:hypothetical protein